MAGWFIAAPNAALAQFGTSGYESSGPLLPEMAAYDVTFYGLDLEVFPETRSIEGAVEIKARVGSPLEWFVLDLVEEYDVLGVRDMTTDSDLGFERRGARIWIKLPGTAQPGSRVNLSVAYGGAPMVARRAPWEGGFQWEKTASGQHWIATSCQGEGADIWWPVKDHVSDEPDSMRIRVTVPEDLFVASNGALKGEHDVGQGRRRFDWYVSTPINTYTVALNIGPYRVLEHSYESVTGEVFPVYFWVLPEDYDRGRGFLPEIVSHLRFFEETLGPYPFRADKYGVVQTPHLGMEHQSIIAYGAKFNNAAMSRVDWGYDALHHHELAHEWWGNLVTALDYRDAWLHEGFGSYMQALYNEEIRGIEHYHRYFSVNRLGIKEAPIAPREATNATDAWSASIYPKGAWLLRTLRFLIGDEAHRKALRRMAYPDPAMESVTDGSQCRFATTDDFLAIAEEVSGMELDWFFEVYARRGGFPELKVDRDGDNLRLEWAAPDSLAFPMPVDILIGDEIQRVEMTAGTASMRVSESTAITVDPDNWILRKRNYMGSVY
jgi:aminopeptidase N